MHLPDRRNQVIRTACPNCSVGLLFARCQLSPNVLATYTRFAWLTGAVLARLTISLLALPFGVGQACRTESIRFQLPCRWTSLSLFPCCCTSYMHDPHCSSAKRAKLQNCITSQENCAAGSVRICERWCDDLARAPGPHGDSWRQVGGCYQRMGEGLHFVSASLRTSLDSQPSTAH